jgi:hypothetical protein
VLLSNHAACTHRALQGVFEHLQSKGIAAPSPVGLQVMVHGTVPLGEHCRSRAVGTARNTIMEVTIAAATAAATSEM